MNPAGPAGNLQRLKTCSAVMGVDLLSSARIDDKPQLEIHESVRGQVRDLPYAVVAGIGLSAPVLKTIVKAPTWTYYYHYRAVNFALDQAALVIAGECARLGYEAFPVPASQILDWDRLRAHLSHREIGGLAGIGWRGRNNLLVNREFGSQCRYVTVLTSLPLPDGAPGTPGKMGKAGMPEAAEAPGTAGTPRTAGTPDTLVDGCGDCRRCLTSCPVGAIHEDPEDFDLDRCSAQLRRFAKSEKISALICGLCVKACGGSRAGKKKGV